MGGNFRAAASVAVAWPYKRENFLSRNRDGIVPQADHFATNRKTAKNF